VFSIAIVFPVAIAFFAAAAFAAAAFAQGYPAKPIKVVAPASPGSAIDVPARLIAHELASRIGRAVVVENMPGAAGNIASAQVARAAPDGYTLLLQITSFVVNPSLYGKVPYDPIKDFQAVILAGRGFGLLLVVGPTLKEVKDVKDLVALSRARPGQLNYASPGIGSPNHLAMELFKRASGADFTHVPYKTPASMVAAVVSGDVATIFSSATVAVPQIKAGKYRVLAAVSPKRSPFVAEAPTLGEAGFPDVKVDIWMGFLVPAGTDRDIVRRLNADFTAVLNTAATREGLFKAGQEAATSTPEEFAEVIRNDLAYWTRVVRDTGIKVE
ncbi:MAG: tripartite tricarboxylate transporter substrate binding protein, partial [Burkholderiales bacterium]|nr:tripartite tricarboxylate transporter substrate binding protein [Burkholderiales bacterium]